MSAVLNSFTTMGSALVPRTIVSAFSYTVTRHVAIFSLSAVEVAVISAVPSDTAVTTPPSVTVATSSSSLDQVTVCASPASTVTVAVKVYVLSVSMVSFDLLRETPVTAPNAMAGIIDATMDRETIKAIIRFLVIFLLIFSSL